MTDLAIRVKGLGKRYTIGQQQASYGSLRETITDAFIAPFRRAASLIHDGRPDPAASANSIWALKDVSFEVQRGEVVGLIGRNGAGKSTLLKVLSQITEPTEGTVELYGRVGSLLEVGTGFHPELTGRENVYLNGAILGMKQEEIERNFEEIVAFAEVEQFIDTPVKHYSSGMYLRLAFAVAAHLEPEILIVDEVLAVGDLAFQNKCLKRMQALTSRGMTVLLVSHNMGAIQSCCSRAIVLERGAITASGDVLWAIQQYQHSLEMSVDSPAESWKGGNGAVNPFGADIVGFEMFGEDGIGRRNVEFGEAVRIRIHLYTQQRIPRPMVNFGLKRIDGLIVCNFNNWYDGFEVDYLEGDCVLEGWLPPLRLMPSFYQIHVLLWHWGGGHLPGDMTRAMPIVAKRFGDLHIAGPPFNHHDGVFQIPAIKWRFSRRGESVEYAEMTSDSIWQAFGHVAPSVNG